LIKYLQKKILFCSFFSNFSKYPTNRVAKDENGQDMGVPGSIQLLQNVGLATQPISSFDWSPDKLGLAVSTSFDQTLRVILVTKLNAV